MCVYIYIYVHMCVYIHLGPLHLDHRVDPAPPLVARDVLERLLHVELLRLPGEGGEGI